MFESRPTKILFSVSVLDHKDFRLPKKALNLDMTKTITYTTVLKKNNGPLPAKTQQTALTNPLKQTLLLAVECMPGYSLLAAYCV